ncbi:unnamed protein product [Cuscuta epithymum]|uniref:Poly(A) RNA polymerase mitochondrial-like central palm domain-containing protein n=1 Tax=Cuscuta epithymum TaxID=186058 RepID=A0AAV0CJ41_9ASTE|nr:unnamed protein product [Cuscuta epithymum]
MTFSVEDLRNKAAWIQSKKGRKFVLTSEKVYRFEELLHDVCLVLFPKPTDYDARRDLIRVFNEIVWEIFECSADAPTVVEFGSFTMDLFHAKSDLDLSVNFGDIDISREEKIHTLLMLEKKFSSLQCSGYVYGVNAIITAIVPVMKVIDSGTGIECDISVANKDGILKSKIIYFISLMDERFRKLCFLMKAWAKAHNINSAKDRTLNSLTIILLVAFHLQTCDPPILPPFSALLRDGYDAGSVEKSVSKFVSYGQNNKQTVAELFFTFLLKLSSVEGLWAQGLCASTYDGSWIFKTWDCGVGRISVEDFSDRTQNVARAVGVKQKRRIYNYIHRSIRLISDFSSGKVDGWKLRYYLFGPDEAASVCEVTKTCNANVATPKPPPICTTRIEDKDTSGHNATEQTSVHMDQRNQPSTRNCIADVTGFKLSPRCTTTRVYDKDTSGQKLSQLPGEHTDRPTKSRAKKRKAKVAKRKPQPGCSTRVDDKDTSGKKETQQPCEPRDQPTQTISKNCNVSVANPKLPPGCATGVVGKGTSGPQASQLPGEHEDGQTQPSSKKHVNAAKPKPPPGGSSTRIDNKDATGQKGTQQPGQHRPTQPTKISNVNKAKPKLPPVQKANLLPSQHRDPSAQPSPSNTTLGKRKRGGSSPPSTRFLQEPLTHGEMASQRSRPYDMARSQPVDNLRFDGPGRAQSSWDRAEPTLPIHPRDMRHTGEMRYHETHRTPYIHMATTMATQMVYPNYPYNQPCFRPPNLSTPSVYPMSTSTVSQISSRYARESDKASTLTTQAVSPNYSYNQSCFRAPSFATPGGYPMSMPIVNQMVSSHAHETFRVGNLPLISNTARYHHSGSSTLYSTYSSYPQLNSSNHEAAWFR